MTLTKKIPAFFLLLAMSMGVDPCGGSGEHPCANVIPCNDTQLASACEGACCCKTSKSDCQGLSCTWTSGCGVDENGCSTFGMGRCTHRNAEPGPPPLGPTEDGGL